MKHIKITLKEENKKDKIIFNKFSEAVIDTEIKEINCKLCPNYSQCYCSGYLKEQRKICSGEMEKEK